MCYMLLVCLLGIALAMAIPMAPAHAQDDALMEAQKRINDEASQAVAAGDYDRAILLLRSSLELNPLDITWLNLGRVYQKAGRCPEARDAYRDALSAPAAEGVPDGMIADRASKWTTELLDTCAGTLAIRCEDPQSVVTVDGRAVACGEDLELAPGEYAVLGRLGEARHAHVARVQALERATILVAPQRPETLVAEALAEDEPEPGSDYRWAGWVGAGLGVVALTSGTLVYVSANDEYQVLKELSATPGGSPGRYQNLKSQVETSDATAVTLWVTGGTLLLASSLFLYLEW